MKNLETEIKSASDADLEQAWRENNELFNTSTTVLGGRIANIIRKACRIELESRKATSSPIGHCDHCNTPILDNSSNYAGTYDDYCCKRCNDEADVEWDAHN